MKRILFAFSLMCCTSLATASDWPAWRGPTGQGHCDEKNVPLKWSAKENVKWKVSLANAGNSTPVVWGESIFVTQATQGGGVRSLIYFARTDGKIKWQKDVNYDEKERAYQPTWYNNASPVTDGERVIVSFASAGMYCYDFTGKELWKRTDLGKWDHQFGSGASPIIYGDLAILWCGPNEKPTPTDRNYLIAVDKKTGKTVWEHDEKEGSWATPVITKIDGKDQMLLGLGPMLKSYDPKTGKELWFCNGLQSYVYPSALYGNGIAVGMSGYGRSSLAVKVGGMGDITKDRLWLHPKPANQRVGSGVIVGEHCYMVDENGLAHCYELTTGKDLWNGEQLKGATWSSIVHAEGRLYLLMKNGDTLVMAANPQFELLATNSLGNDSTYSSIVISNGQIFIRTFKHLWCIETKK